MYWPEGSAGAMYPCMRPRSLPDLRRRPESNLTGDLEKNRHSFYVIHTLPDGEPLRALSNVPTGIDRGSSRNLCPVHKAELNLPSKAGRPLESSRKVCPWNC